MMNLEFLKKKVFQVDGITMTVGVLLLILVVGYLWLRARR